MKANISRLDLSRSLINELLHHLPSNSKSGWVHIISKIVAEKLRLYALDCEISAQINSIRVTVHRENEITDDSIITLVNIFTSLGLMDLSDDKSHSTRIPGILRKKPFYKSIDKNIVITPIKNNNAILTGIELCTINVDLSDKAYLECCTMLRNASQMQSQETLNKIQEQTTVSICEEKAEILNIKDPPVEFLMDAYLSISLRDYSLIVGKRNGVSTMKISGKTVTYFVFLPLLKDINEQGNIENWFLDRIKKYDQFARIKEITEPYPDLGTIKTKIISATGKPEKFIDDLIANDNELFLRIKEVALLPRKK